MDLLEYQAKELFRQMGIPVLPSQQIHHPKDLKGLKIPYPVVLKSQVYTGGRGKAGGIRFVENTIDAVAAAQTIFHLPIMGQYPEVVLAEAKYASDRELYLAVALDQSSRRPILLGSQEGGMEIEPVIANMQRVIVDQEFSPFYARRLALKMGLRGELIQSVSLIVEKMYRLFIQNDLDLVEINPLAVSPDGELMALDGKVTVNDDALERHADLALLKPHILEQTTKTAIASKFAPVELEGAIAILGNGMGLTMATVDLLSRAGGKPANFLNIGAEYRYDLPTSSLTTRIAQGLEVVTQAKSVKAVLVNILANVTSCAEIAATITEFVEHPNFGKPLPALAVRLVGQEVDAARDVLAAVDITLFEDLDDAIAHVVVLSKSHKA
jgi:succinyl-CoA synthetase beta subunit